MVLLETLLPLLLEDENDHHASQAGLLGVVALVNELADHGITTDADLLFSSSSASLSLEAVRTLETLGIKHKIANFLAAEGNTADELYAALHEASASSAAHIDVCRTGIESVDKLLGGGWSGEVVEVLGETGTGKTWVSQALAVQENLCAETRSCYVVQLALHTVLKRLHEHPNERALWLDTTASFSAERGSQILEAITSAAVRPSEAPATLPAQTGSPTSPSGIPDLTRPNEDPVSEGPNALDRLIVAKVFDLASAIQAIQQVRTPASVGEELDGTKREESNVPAETANNKPGALNDSAATVYSNEVPETGIPAIELLHSSENPDDKGEDEKMSEIQEHISPSVATSSLPQLRFIVIDSIAALLKGVLSATSAKGHARMMSFMRLLRSIAAPTSADPQAKITIFLINNLVSLASSANSTVALQSVFPAVNAKKYKAALGPSFTYLTDWTIYLTQARDVFPQYKSSGDIQGEEARQQVIFEVVRSRRMVSRYDHVTRLAGAES